MVTKQLQWSSGAGLVARRHAWPGRGGGRSGAEAKGIGD
jgi:hypothetical protein